MKSGRYLSLVGLLLAVTAAADEQEIAEQRAAVAQLPRRLTAAKDDLESRSSVVDEAIRLGPLGVERLRPLLQKEVVNGLTRYGKILQARARRQKDADVATLLAEDPSLPTMRARLLETAGLLVRLNKAVGEEAEPVEEQLQKAETQFLREVRLGPVLSQLSDEELAAVEETNKQRAAHRLPPLQLDVKLALAARDHSADMVKHGFFDHTSPIVGKSKPSDRAKRFGTLAAGENIQEGAQTGADAVTAWMNSEGHRANILKPDYRRVGVGRHEDHWTQMFGK